MKPVPPCYQCEARRPECHSPEACAAWAEFETKQQAFYAEKAAALAKADIEGAYAWQRCTRRQRRERHSSARK